MKLSLRKIKIVETPEANKLFLQPMSKSALLKFFTPFKDDISSYQLPQNFTYPFCYEPHPLTKLASEELQSKLALTHPKKSKTIKGRMYGVLVVKNNKGELGYLSAISGNNIIDKSVSNGNNLNLVPMVFELSNDNNYFMNNQAKVNHINAAITEKENDHKLISLQEKFALESKQSIEEINQLKSELSQAKKARKEKREWLANNSLTNEENRKISIELSRESVTNKKRLIALKEHWQAALNRTKSESDLMLNEIKQLKKDRKKLSSKLQKYLFKQYELLNSKGESKNLLELFKDTISPIPPAGSGDCAAPKLLQFAFSNHLTPICMAEFWWGASPKSEIRRHGHFYPACQGKCQPILTHMLSDMSVDPNPLLNNPAEDVELEIVFQDKDIVVVNKPAGLLSVPGKTIQDSVFARIKTKFPDAKGSLIVHRLDMATSGLLVLALTERAHKNLQHQFIKKEVSKRYIATIEGSVEQNSGTIALPLCLDILDRPRQKVCFEHGKYAETKWEVIQSNKNQTKLFLYPITGRTHQLRMHCAHPDGLNAPIVGDSLYGTQAERLHLHAQRLSFAHPITKEKLTFEIEPNF